MNLDELYKFINYITNKEQSGNTIPPDTYNLLLKTANIDVFRVKYGLPQEYKGGALPIQAYESIQLITDALSPFKVVMGEDNPLLINEDGKAKIPNDYVHYSSLIYKQYVYNSGKYVIDECGNEVFIQEKSKYKYRNIEVLKDAEVGDYLSNSLKYPTKENPVCCFYNDYIQFYPKDLHNVIFVYLRLPVTPYYYYEILDDYTYKYIPEKSIELEWREDMHLDIARIILGYIGINLRENDLYQYVEAQKIKGV